MKTKLDSHHTHHIAKVIHGMKKILNELPIQVRRHSCHCHENRFSSALWLFRQCLHILLQCEVKALLLVAVTCQGLVHGGSFGNIFLI